MSNNVVTVIKLTPEHFEVGDLFKNGTEGTYILTTFTHSGDQFWCAVNLKDGHTWDKPQTSIADAVAGLRFVGRKLTIIVTNDKS